MTFGSGFGTGFGPSLGTGATASTGTSSKTDSMSDLMSLAPESKPKATSTTGDKKRGPNSHRVRNMFDAITTNRIPLDDLINKHNVSVHVARQSKRFDPFAERGQIVIKTLSDDAVGTKTTYIWRVPNAP